VLAVPWQIAQKLHAVTEPPLRAGGENARYWDLIDLQLLQILAEENLVPVKEACVQTFAVRRQQAWPPRITIYPDWAPDLRRPNLVPKLVPKRALLATSDA
jgi:hypothetical protein